MAAANRETLLGSSARRWLARLLLAGLTGLATLVVCEVGLRLSGKAYRPLMAKYSPSVLSIRPLLLDRSSGWTYHYEPNQTTLHCYDTTVGAAVTWDTAMTERDGTPRGCLRYRINSLGYRDEDLAVSGVAAATGDRHVIMVLGDSFTFGEGLRREQRFSDVLARRLEDKEPGRYDVRNRGVQGHWLEAELALYLKRLQFEAPATVILAMYPNDAQPLEPGANPDTEYDRPLVRSEVPEAALAWYRPRIPGFIKSRLTNRANRRIWVSEILATYEGASGRRFDTAFARLASEVQDADARLIVLLFPMAPLLDDRWQGYPLGAVHERVARLAAEHRCALIDLLPEVEDWPRRRLFVHPTDGHGSAELNALAAERLLTVLRSPHAQ